MIKDKKIKVLRVITRLNIGGPAQHVTFLEESLDKGLFESKLVLGAVDSNEGDMSFLARERALSLIEIPELSNQSGLIANLIALFKLYRVTKKEKPHIVHLHLLKARILGGLAAKVAGVPIILETFHGNLLKEYYGFLKTSIILLLEKFVGNLVADWIIAISPSQKQELVNFGIANGDKIRIINIGLELERFLNSQGKIGGFKNELGLRDNVLLVGIVGRLVPIKGHRYFLEAAREVLEVTRDLNTKFLIIGDGELRRELKEYSKKLGIEDFVVFTGWRVDLERIYSDMDVVVLSSLNEGTPVSIIEAMASEKAVVATRVGGVPDVVEDGVSGLMVSPKNPKALAQAIIRLLKDSELRAALGIEGRKRVYPKYDVTTLVENTGHFYQELIKLRT
jgi:glycosyltransferase involved in cell wall biosynthesis